MRYLTTIPIKLKTSDGEVELRPGDTFKPKSEEAIKGLLTDGKVKPVAEVMAEKYQSLTGWLHSFDPGSDELKETLPGLYMDIQDAIERFDKAFLIEDLPVFQDNLERIRLLYTEALFSCGRRIAIKVWSKPLGCHLWIVADNEDMHSLRSQGVSEAIYTDGEIKKLKGLGKDSLKEIHKFKEVFKGSKVEEITRKVKN
jgi:hypothetical protein